MIGSNIYDSICSMYTKEGFRAEIMETNTLTIGPGLKTDSYLFAQITRSMATTDFQTCLKCMIQPSWDLISPSNIEPYGVRRNWGCSWIWQSRSHQASKHGPFWHVLKPVDEGLIHQRDPDRPPKKHTSRCEIILLPLPSKQPMDRQGTLMPPKQFRWN